MNKMQAYHSFWSGFGLTAYDETTVPDNAVFPYLTYEAVDDEFGRQVPVSASLWYRTTTWSDIVQKSKEIYDEISRGGIVIPYDNSSFWIRRGTPFAQRMSDDSDDSVRRIVLNCEVEFFD